MAATFLAHLWDALLMAAAMAWHVGWSLVLGFTLSGLVQSVVSPDRMRAQLGRNDLASIARATAYGAASSSCSYAAAALSKTIFRKGAGFIPALAFLFASTNLVVELGIVLWLLMGWQFTAAEWLGGLVLVTFMSLLVRATYPRRAIEAARVRLQRDAAAGDDDGGAADARTLWTKLCDRQTWTRTAQTAAMDWSMLRGDLVAGFLIAGALSAFVPDAAWKHIFLTGAPPAIAVVADAAAGALLAIITFVCSIGNVPMAAILWGSGVSFSGVIAFLFADLIVLPLLDVYRKYYGTRLALYIFGVFFVTIVASAVAVDALVTALHLIPHPALGVRASLESFRIDTTFWLNAIALAVSLWFWRLNATHPAEHTCAMHAHAAHEPDDEKEIVHR